MKNIKVLGSGCKKCVKTAEILQTVADDCHIEVNILKENNPVVFIQYDVLETPAVVIDEKLVHSGSVPSKEIVERWLI